MPQLLAIGLIQRDDGALRNALVSLDSLKPDVLLALGAGSDTSIALQAAQMLEAEGCKVVGHHGDLSSEAGCRQLIDTAIEAFGQLDILIHNAGWVGYQEIESTDAGFLERALQINVHAPIWLCTHAWPYLRQASDARVILTTSDRAMYQQYAQAGLVAYSAGKMAQLGIMNALSMEGAADNIMVNAISPVARTRMWGEIGEPQNLKPEWVVPGVVFLASAQCRHSGYILRASNGQFTATRFAEHPDVDYPVDLTRVQANSPEQIAQRWDWIREC